MLTYLLELHFKERKKGDWSCAMKNKKIKIGQLLMESLTAEQIACMLEVVASAGGLKSLMDDFIKADPANAYKSDYNDHALWCKAVHELNQKTYNALLSRWRKKHNRRRNLWRDMKAVGLPV
jgi:hypothetical protein